jgi:hypothetical protein
MLKRMRYITYAFVGLGAAGLATGSAAAGVSEGWSIFLLLASFVVAIVPCLLTIRELAKSGDRQQPHDGSGSTS